MDLVNLILLAFVLAALIAALVLIILTYVK